MDASSDQQVVTCSKLVALVNYADFKGTLPDDVPRSHVISLRS